MCIMSKSIDLESRLRRSLWRSLSSIPVWHEQNGLEHKPKSVFMEIAKFNSESSKKLDSYKVMNVKYRSFGGSNTQ